MRNRFIYDTLIGKLLIEDNNKAITKVYLIEEFDSNIITEETELIKEAIKQINEYFEGKRTVFNLPLALEGTDFQKKVWNELIKIPYGETRTYGEIAKYIGNEKASRAVGMANNKNPIIIMIPCHRVIGANGKLVGYLGGLHIKEKLLNIEKVTKDNLNYLN